MTAKEKKAVKELLKQARRQVRNHGHCCGFGSAAANKDCKICIPTMEAVREVSKLLK